MVPNVCKLIGCLLAVLTVGNAHLCITDPPQRLQVGSRLHKTCYQLTGPCGPDFPSTPLQNIPHIKEGSRFPVQLYLPVRHYSPQYKGKMEVNIKRMDAANFSLLTRERDSADAYRNITVRMPTRKGHYILQVIYQPEGYIFYSCADVILGDETAEYDAYNSSGELVSGHTLTMSLLAVSVAVSNRMRLSLPYCPPPTCSG